MTTKKLKLSQLEKAVKKNEEINTNSRSNNHIHAKEILVIKRDGREEPYSFHKMRKVCLWACDNNEDYCNNLLSSTQIKLYNKIKIADVYDELIKTAVNNISRMHPNYENIAAKLYLLKIYREAWNIKTNKTYPHLAQVIKKGLNYKLYSKDIYDKYSKEDVNKINKAIIPERDYLFTYKSLYTFYSKYCLNYSKYKKLELPQHTYLRIAMALFINEKEDRIEKIINFYNMVSQHYFTLATPIMLNSGTKNQQLSSCVLSKMGDSADSIMNTAYDVAIYSKFKGGNAIDISDVRSSGSFIMGNAGFSSGPVPFIKIIESTVKAFNQGSSRPGACAIYFQWWHYNFEDLIVLKSNSGTEENRARHLKYAVKINDLLINRLLKNENVSLFDPVDVPKLKFKYGKEFEKEYIKYEKKEGLRKKVLSARKVFEMIMKERVETGNVYLYHEENVNAVSMLNRYINSSNLCTEITLPSRESIKDDFQESKSEYWYKINKQYEAGEISLCNLASVNLNIWGNLSEKQQRELVAVLVRAMDNTIDVAIYPVIEGYLTNINYRYLGIGVLNLANFLASKKIVIDSKEALEKTHEVFDQLSYQIISASKDLAIEKGPFNRIEETLWHKGELPIFKANKKALKLTKYQPNMEKWKKLAEEIKIHGIRNAQLMAIAPTATSGKAINATESTEPIQHFFYKEDGKINLPTLVPNIKNWKYYKVSYDCDQYNLIELAAIRQCYLDQAQSINIYFKKVSSLTDFTLHHLYGFKLGLKTFYYCKTEKDSIDEVCESCT
ncbi:MAG: ribonucleoside-diphosphate reductase subunit alpha [Mycoplasmoidaceae bacterium]